MAGHHDFEKGGAANALPESHVISIPPVEFDGFSTKAFAKWVLASRQRIRDDMGRHEIRVAEALENRKGEVNGSRSLGAPDSSPSPSAE